MSTPSSNINDNPEMLLLDAEIERAKKYRELIEEQNRMLETIYKWEAPERLHVTRSREWYLAIASASVVVIIFASLTNNIGLIFAVIALLFFMYAISNVVPNKVTHELTNKGLKVLDKLYLWKNLISFWVVERNGQYILQFEYIESQNQRTSSRMMLLAGNADIKYLVSYIVQRVDYLSSKEAPGGFLGNQINGKYQPLLLFLENNDSIKTKDPKDSPEELKKQIEIEKEKELAKNSSPISQ